MSKSDEAAANYELERSARNDAKHTETPWIQVEGDRFSKEVMITTADRVKNSMSPICEMDVDYTGKMGIEQPANAEFIVRAVNAHDDLVKALQELRKYPFMDSFERKKLIEAALAKAQGA